MNIRFSCIAILSALALAGDQTCVAADEAQPTARKKGEAAEVRTPDLKTDINVLNQCEKQPEKIKELYLAARGFFAARADATYADLVQDAAFKKLCDQEKLLLLGGPMLGCIAPDGASVWVRTARPARVEVRVEGVAQPFGPVESTVESDLAAVVPVTGLKPGGRFAYEVLVDGKPADLPKHAAIATPLDTRDKTRIAFGTCPHRWGLGNSRQAELILGRQPVAMLVYGDVAVQDRYNNLAMHRADYFMRDCFAAWRRLACTLPLYASWDDHDYFGNDLAGIPPGYTDADRRGVRDVFRRAWVNPAYGAKDEGIYFRTRIGPADVIMLDTRYFRTGRKKGSYLGEDQLAWLEKQLLACQGPFIILSSGTMWSDYVSGGKDSWGACEPAARERIFSLIEKKRIPGVLLISGDRHGARGFRIPRPSGFVFHEFEPASLGARSGPEVSKPEWKDVQLFGIDKQYAFGEFEFDTVPADPSVTFRLIDENAKTLFEIALRRSELTPK
jgi:alkaline phosphatase D